MNEDELGQRSTWDDEDAQLLWQATARADALMRDGCVSVGWRHLGLVVSERGRGPTSRSPRQPAAT